jgi:hypothetical protein
LELINCDGTIRHFRHEQEPALVAALPHLVLGGEGKAIRKWDGLAVMVKGGAVFKRYSRCFRL